MQQPSCYSHRCDFGVSYLFKRGYSHSETLPETAGGLGQQLVQEPADFNILNRHHCVFIGLCLNFCCVLMDEVWVENKAFVFLSFSLSVSEISAKQIHVCRIGSRLILRSVSGESDVYFYPCVVSIENNTCYNK